jgi:hypothetical protein
MRVTWKVPTSLPGLVHGDQQRVGRVVDDRPQGGCVPRPVGLVGDVTARSADRVVGEQGHEGVEVGVRRVAERDGPGAGGQRNGQGEVVDHDPTQPDGPSVERLRERRAPRR